VRISHERRKKSLIARTERTLNFGGCDDVAAERTQHYQLLAGALIALLRFGLTRREQIVVRAILLARTPPSALKVAKQTGLAYSHIPPNHRGRCTPTSSGRMVE
jgi:hypothetical protein